MIRETLPAHAPFECPNVSDRAATLAPPVELVDESPHTSISKALLVLDKLASFPGGVAGVSELALATELPKSTVHRMLKALEERDYVGRTGSQYTFGLRVLGIAGIAWRSKYAEIRRTSEAPLVKLFRRTGWTAHLAVLDKGEVLYINKLIGREGWAIPSGVGQRIPANCTALGKAMLAFGTEDFPVGANNTFLPALTPYSISSMKTLQKQLEKVRVEGIALDHQESRLNIGCVAAPVMGGDSVVAAISLGGPEPHFKPEKYANAVREAAVEMSRRLTGVKPPS